MNLVPSRSEGASMQTWDRNSRRSVQERNPSLLYEANSVMKYRRLLDNQFDMTMRQVSELKGLRDHAR